tara:strand:+ start:467 stop:1774 length:1308 start_codon:yes stop_codon:yes gene_type:complete
MSFLRHLGFFAVGRFYLSLTLFVIGVLTARWLGPEGRGYYALLFTVVGLASNAANIGLSQANTYFLNRKNTGLGTLTGNTMAFLFVAAFIFAVGLVMVGGMFGESPFGIPGREAWLLAWFGILALLTEASFRGLILGSHLYDFQSCCLFVQATLLLLATLLINPWGGSLEIALELRVYAMVLFAAGYVAAFRIKVGSISPKLVVSCLRKQLSFGVRNWFQNLIGFLNYRGYLLVLGSLAGPEAMGIFSVALLFVEAVRFLPDTVSTILLPKLVGMEVGPATGEYAAMTCRVIIFISLLLAGGLFVLAPWVVPALFGNVFREGVTVAQILLVGAVFGIVYQVLTRYFTSEAKQSYSIYSALLALVTAGILSFFLVPKLGAEGAAFAFAASSLTAAVSMLMAFRRHTGLPILRVLVLMREDWKRGLNLLAGRASTNA